MSRIPSDALEPLLLLIFVDRKAGIYFIPRRRVVLAQWCAAVTCEPCCLTVTLQAAQKSLSYSLVLSFNGGSVGLVNLVILPVDNNEHQRIDDVSTDRISYDIRSVETMGFAL